MTAHGVRTYTRTGKDGKRQTVTRHYRTTRGGGRDYGSPGRRKPLLSPRHAGKLAKKAWRARRRHKAAAAGFGLLALLELVSWLAADTLGMLLAAVGLLAMAGAAGAHATSRGRGGGGGGGARPPAPPKPKPKPKPAPERKPEPPARPAAMPSPGPGRATSPPAAGTQHDKESAAPPAAGGPTEEEAAVLAEAYGGGGESAP